jgi:D-aminopeptidase
MLQNYCQAQRIDGLEVEHSANSIVEAYKTFALLIFASAGGHSNLGKLSES